MNTAMHKQSTVSESSIIIRESNIKNMTCQDLGQIDVNISQDVGQIDVNISSDFRSPLSQDVGQIDVN